MSHSDDSTFERKGSHKKALQVQAIFLRLKLGGKIVRYLLTTSKGRVLFWERKIRYVTFFKLKKWNGKNRTVFGICTYV